MSGSLTRPDFSADIKALARRLDVLERRVAPATPAPAVSSDGHDGDGTASTVIPLANAASPTAAGLSATAMGSAANASADETVAIGAQAWAYGDRGIAIGHLAEAGMGAVTVGQDANADGAGSIAIGEDANAAHSESIALGHVTATTGTSQVNIGNRRLYAGCPPAAPTDATLNTSQVTIWLNQTSHLLTFKVKYSTGVVKSGTVALT